MSLIGWISQNCSMFHKRVTDTEKCYVRHTNRKPYKRLERRKSQPGFQPPPWDCEPSALLTELLREGNCSRMREKTLSLYHPKASCRAIFARARSRVSPPWKVWTNKDGSLSSFHAAPPDGVCQKREREQIFDTLPWWRAGAVLTALLLRGIWPQNSAPWRCTFGDTSLVPSDCSVGCGQT